MGTFNRYMDRITADDALKEKTKSFLTGRLAELAEEQAAAEQAAAARFRTRRLAYAVSSFAAAAVIMTAGFLFYRTPAAYLSLDINPGIELTVNALGRVIGAEAMNGDGETVLAEEQVRNSSVESAVRALVRTAHEKGFIRADGSSAIAVTAASDKAGIAVRLEREAARGAELALEDTGSFAAVYENRISLAVRSEASAAGLSPGKYQLIRMLQAMDPAIEMKQYRDATVSEIIAEAGALSGKYGISGEIGAEMRGMLERAETAVRDMEKNREKAKNQKQEQSQSGSSACESGPGSGGAGSGSRSGEQGGPSGPSQDQGQSGGGSGGPGGSSGGGISGWSGDPDPSGNGEPSGNQGSSCASSSCSGSGQDDPYGSREEPPSGQDQPSSQPYSQDQGTSSQPYGSQAPGTSQGASQSGGGTSKGN